MTTEYLLDTNVCIAIRDLLNSKTPGNPEKKQQLERIKAKWSRVPGGSVAMSVITLGELEFGVAKSANPSTAKARLNALRQQIKLLHFDDTVTEHYGSIRAHLESAGQAIGPNDTWIAAHGRASSRTVVTHNMNEFTRVPGLTHEDWAA
jgi:tRNA(fMet)-specific endonuclease VapC